MKERSIVGGIAKFVVLLLLVFGALGLYKFLEGQKELPKTRPAKPAITYVPVDTVNYGPVPVRIEADGRVVSSQIVSISAEVQGTLLSGAVPLKEGASFRRGQVLFRIDSREAQLTLSSTKSGFLRTLGGLLPNIRVDFPTAYDTWQDYYEKLDVAKTMPRLPTVENSALKNYLVSNNLYDSYYNIKAAEERLSKYTAVAPFDGSIVEAFREVGGLASPGVAVLSILRSDALELELPLSVQEAKFVEVGDKVRIFSPEINEVWWGTVSRKGQFLQRSTQSLTVYVDVPQAKGKLYDGMYLQGQIAGKPIPSAAMVPRRALVGANDVYVIQQDSLLHRTELEVLLAMGDSLVTRGLSEGNKLVLEPPLQAEEGMVVSLLAPNAGIPVEPEPVDTTRRADDANPDAL